MGCLGGLLFGAGGLLQFFSAAHDVLLKEVLAQVECATGAAVAGALCSCLQICANVRSADERVFLSVSGGDGVVVFFQLYVEKRPRLNRVYHEGADRYVVSLSEEGEVESVLELLIHVGLGKGDGEKRLWLHHRDRQGFFWNNEAFAIDCQREALDLAVDTIKDIGGLRNAGEVLHQDASTSLVGLYGTDNLSVHMRKKLLIHGGQGVHLCKRSVRRLGSILMWVYFRFFIVLFLRLIGSKRSISFFREVYSSPFVFPPIEPKTWIAIDFSTSPIVKFFILSHATGNQ